MNITAVVMIPLIDLPTARMHTMHCQPLNGKAASKGPRPDDLPHVIVSDIEMPKMDGLTFCKKIKGDTGLKKIPFIIFSSLINEQMVLKCKSVGAGSYVTKPETNKLVSILDEICLRGRM